MKINVIVLICCNNRKETSLHGLINNAGIMAVDFAMTKDNYESQFQVSFCKLPYKEVLTFHLKRPIIFPTGFSPTTYCRS